MKLIPLTEDDMTLLSWGGTVFDKDRNKVKIITTFWDSRLGFLARDITGKTWEMIDLYQEDSDD